jgi:hypothetical protein
MLSERGRTAFLAALDTPEAERPSLESASLDLANALGARHKTDPRGAKIIPSTPRRPVLRNLPRVPENPMSWSGETPGKVSSTCKSRDGRLRPVYRRTAIRSWRALHLEGSWASARRCGTPGLVVFLTRG